MHLLGQFLEIGVESDACESQNESPVLVLVKDSVDFLYSGAAENRLDEERSDQRGDEETDDEFREAGPDFTGSNLLLRGLVNPRGEEYSDGEGDESDQDVLDHLDKGSHLLSLGAEGATSENHGSG